MKVHNFLPRSLGYVNRVRQGFSNRKIQNISSRLSWSGPQQPAFVLPRPKKNGQGLSFGTLPVSRLNT